MTLELKGQAYLSGLAYFTVVVYVQAVLSHPPTPTGNPELTGDSISHHEISGLFSPY